MLNRFKMLQILLSNEVAKCRISRFREKLKIVEPTSCHDSYDG